MKVLALLNVVLIVAMPVAASVFRVWVHNDAVQMGYELSREGARRRELRRLEQQLEVELAAQHSPENLTDQAAVLNLRPPDPDQMVGNRVWKVRGGDHE